MWSLSAGAFFVETKDNNVLPPTNAKSEAFVELRPMPNTLNAGEGRRVLDLPRDV